MDTCVCYQHRKSDSVVSATQVDSAFHPFEVDKLSSKL